MIISQRTHTQSSCKRTAATFITETYQLRAHSVIKEGISHERGAALSLKGTQICHRILINSTFALSFHHPLGRETVVVNERTLGTIAHGEQSTSNRPLVSLAYTNSEASKIQHPGPSVSVGEWSARRLLSAQ